MLLGDLNLGVSHGMRYGRKDQVLVVNLTELRLVRRERFAGLLEPLAPEAFPHGTSCRRSVGGHPSDVSTRSGSQHYPIDYPIARDRIDGVLLAYCGAVPNPASLWLISQGGCQRPLVSTSVTVN